MLLINTKKHIKLVTALDLNRHIFEHKEIRPFDP